MDDTELEFGGGGGRASGEPPGEERLIKKCLEVQVPGILFYTIWSASLYVEWALSLVICLQLLAALFECIRCMWNPPVVLL